MKNRVDAFKELIKRTYRWGGIWTMAENEKGHYVVGTVHISGWRPVARTYWVADRVGEWPTARVKLL